MRPLDEHRGHLIWIWSLEIAGNTKRWRLITEVLDIDEFVAGCLAEIEDDYLGLWVIVGRVRQSLKVASDSEVRWYTLQIVRALIRQGLWPMDYLKTGIVYWAESDENSIIARIKEEWSAQKIDPNLAQPICWFALRNPGLRR